MIDAVEIAMVLTVLTDLFLLGSSRLRSYIQIVAFQGVIIGLLPLLTNDQQVIPPRATFLAASTIVIKGIVFPRILSRVMWVGNMRGEIEPCIRYAMSIIVGVLALAGSLWLSNRLQVNTVLDKTLIVPVGFYNIFVGLFIIITRRKAVTQVVAYLVLENGIYAFGVSMANDQPLIIEMGVLLDVFVAVFIMGIAIFHINREFDDIDVDRLSALQDTTVNGHDS